MSQNQDKKLIWNKKFIIKEKPFVRSADGVMNAVVEVDGERSRNRVSCIVMKGTKVYVAIDKDGEYTIPGGGVEQGRTPIQQAEREVHEETHMKVKNIRETGIQFLESHKTVKPWVKENVPNEKDWWSGYFTTLYIAEYDGVFNGKVAEKDLDPQIENTGKFYEFDEICEKKGFLAPWKKAIENYIYDSKYMCESLFYEMARISKERTNLPYDIWIDDQGKERNNTHHEPRIKVVVGESQIPMIIDKTNPDIPESVKRNGTKTFKDINIIKQFIIDNYDILMKHWNRVLDSVDAILEIQKKTNPKSLKKSENLSEAHRDDPEVVKLTHEIRDDAQRLDDLGININRMVNKDFLDELCEKDPLPEESPALLKEDVVQLCDGLLKEIVTEAESIQQAEFGHNTTVNDKMELAKRTQQVARTNAKIAENQKKIINNSPAPVKPEVKQEARRNDAQAQINKAKANATVSTLKSINSSYEVSLDDVIAESSELELLDEDLAKVQKAVADQQIQSKQELKQKIQDSKEKAIENFDKRKDAVDKQIDSIKNAKQAEKRQQKLQNAQEESINEGAKNYDLKNFPEYKAKGFDVKRKNDMTRQFSKEYNSHDIGLQFALKNRLFAGKTGQVVKYLLEYDDEKVELDSDTKYIADIIKKKTDAQITIRRINMELKKMPPNIDNIMKYRVDLIQIYNNEVARHNKDSKEFNKLYGGN